MRIGTLAQPGAEMAKKIVRAVVPMFLVAGAMVAVDRQEHHRKCVGPAPGIDAPIKHPSQNCIQCHKHFNTAEGRPDSEWAYANG